MRFQPVLVVLLVFILALKTALVAWVRGFSLSASEILLLAGIDVFFMMLIAYLMASPHHGTASTAFDGS